MICAYTDIPFVEDLDAERVDKLVYETPIYEMLLGEGGYEPVINMKQYRDIKTTIENVLRFRLGDVSKAPEETPGIN